MCLITSKAPLLAIGPKAGSVKVVEKGFDAAGSVGRGFAYCLADSDNPIGHVAAGQAMFQIAHQLIKPV
jgi:hypothetical protein